MRRLRGAISPRVALAGALALLALGAVYFLFVRQSARVGEVIVPIPTSVIGGGSDAVAVGPEGQILDWLPAPQDGTLPQLPLQSVPKKGALGGTMLDQARVLGAAPARLRPYLEQSSFGASGVDVMLRSGIELRFGDPSQATEKWRAAAIVLASPTTTSLDYVDLHAPTRPAVGGSGHTLPALR